MEILLFCLLFVFFRIQITNFHFYAQGFFGDFLLFFDGGIYFLSNGYRRWLESNILLLEMAPTTVEFKSTKFSVKESDPKSLTNFKLITYQWNIILSLCHNRQSSMDERRQIVVVYFFMFLLFTFIDSRKCHEAKVEFSHRLRLTRRDLPIKFRSCADLKKRS